VSLEDTYKLVETTYDAAPAPLQAAWAALWSVVAMIGHDDKEIVHFARQQLAQILEPLDDTGPYQWTELKKKLVGVAGETIAVRRIDGFDTPYERPPVKERTPASSERIIDHERALQASWDLDRLAVYADDLQELGDARGELISLDLKLIAQRIRGDLEFRRDTLHDEIFGGDYNVKSQYGLAHIEISTWSDDPFPRLFVGDVARYLRELQITGPSANVASDFELVLAEQRPWLRRLALSMHGRREPSFDVAAIASLLPNLEELDLEIDDEAFVLVGFVHPRVRRLRASQLAAFARLGAPWPQLAELELVFHDAGDDAYADTVTAERFPALRRLDLGSNEPYADTIEEDRFACRVDLFTALHDFDPAMLAELRWLRLPSPRTREDVDTIQFVIDHAPVLETLEIVRRYPGGPEVELTHPTAKLVVPPPSSWRPADQIAYRASLVIEGALFGMSLASLGMERHYRSLPLVAQASWNALWQQIGEGQIDHTFQFSAARLYAAIEALQKCDDYTFHDTIEKVFAVLHAPAIVDKTLAIRIARDAL
jgi:hypothetical protein